MVGHWCKFPLHVTMNPMSGDIDTITIHYIYIYTYYVYIYIYTYAYMLLSLRPNKTQLPGLMNATG